MKFTPGPGVGGHCLPIDPTYLSWEVKRRVGRSLRLIDMANEVNTAMPRYVAERAVLLLNEQGKAAKGAKVLLLGLGYKKNSGDVRESPAVRVAERLHDFGCELSAESAAAADLIVVLTEHDDVDCDALLGVDTPVLDTRHRLDASAWGHVQML